MNNSLKKNSLLFYGYLVMFIFTMGFNLLMAIQGPKSSELIQLIKPVDAFLYSDGYYQEYSKILGTIAIASVLCIIMFIISYIFSFSNKKEYEKASEYECGFEPFDSATRQPFDVHFYIVGILFLIFDVEVALLFPWAVGLDVTGTIGFWSMVSFLIILTIGFVYEWQRGALSWPHPTIDLKSQD